jgi:hypothetical protein
MLLIMKKIEFSKKGLTLVEIIAASVIGVMLAGGLMISFVLAVKLAHKGTFEGEGYAFAQQTIERFRNHIACRQAGETINVAWFDGTICDADFPAGAIADPLPVVTDPSVVNFATNRTIEIENVDLDGDGNPDNDFDGDGKPDYLVVRAKLQWNPPQ